MNFTLDTNNGITRKITAESLTDAIIFAHGMRKIDKAKFVDVFEDLKFWGTVTSQGMQWSHLSGK